MTTTLSVGGAINAQKIKGQKKATKKKAAPKKAAPEVLPNPPAEIVVAPVTTVELRLTDGILDYSDIWAFVQKHAGGQEGNVRIVPLENVDLTSAEPVPFGYGGKVGGVRQRIQDWMLKGIDGDTSLKLVLGKAAKLGHSRKKPNCLLALMNGGYTPSSKYWGTAYVKLVVENQPKA